MDKEKFEKIEEEAKKDDAEAQCKLGACYYRGLENIGIKKDEKKALYWMTKAADQGNVYAQGILGMFYLGGVGCEANVSTSNYWYTKAAEGGDEYAQWCIGIEYQNGDRVDIAPNLEKAKYWFQKAADQGYENGIRDLEVINNMNEFKLDDNNVLFISKEQTPKDIAIARLKTDKQDADIIVEFGKDEFYRKKEYAIDKLKYIIEKYDEIINGCVAYDEQVAGDTYLEGDIEHLEIEYWNIFRIKFEKDKVIIFTDAYGAPLWYEDLEEIAESGEIDYDSLEKAFLSKWVFRGNYYAKLESNNAFKFDKTCDYLPFLNKSN